MIKVRRFEDLICWQKARGLANTIHGLTRHPEFLKDFRELPNDYLTIDY